MMDFSYDSISGKYVIKCNIKKNLFNISIVIPYGCQAIIELPNKNQFSVNDGTFNYKCTIDKKLINRDINNKKTKNV